MDVEKEKLHIRLHLYDTDMQVYVHKEEEAFYRKAAKLITDTVNSYSEKFKTSRSGKEILYMAMLDIAINLEFENERNNTKPYNDILAKITTEIEDALGVSK